MRGGQKRHKGPYRVEFLVQEVALHAPPNTTTWPTAQVLASHQQSQLPGRGEGQRDQSAPDPVGAHRTSP